MKKLKFKTSGILILNIFLLIVLTACSNDNTSMQMESTVPVSIKQVEFKEMNEYVSASGTLYAIKEAQIKIEQAGKYRLNLNPRTNKPYAMGDKVKAGEIIITIEDPEYVNQVALQSKKLSLDASKREFEKQNRIYKKGGITLSELSEAERTFVDAEYSYENAKLSLEKLKIMAPFDGIIVELPYFTPGQEIDASTAVVNIMDYTQLYSDLTLPGKEMTFVQRDQKVTVTHYNSVEKAQGSISQVSPSLDPDTRMFTARIIIDNPKLLLKPGMFAKVEITVKSKPSVIVIPRDIILDRNGSKIVYIVNRGIAIERRIQTGMTNRSQVEVLKGLEKEDRIITKGFETLRQGTHVTIVK